MFLWKNRLSFPIFFDSDLLAALRDAEKYHFFAQKLQAQVVCSNFVYLQFAMALDLHDFPADLKGVLDGDQVRALFTFAQKKGFAIPKQSSVPRPCTRVLNHQISTGVVLLISLAEFFRPILFDASLSPSPSRERLHIFFSTQFHFCKIFVKHNEIHAQGIISNEFCSCSFSLIPFGLYAKVPQCLWGLSKF